MIKASITNILKLCFWKRVKQLFKNLSLSR